MILQLAGGVGEHGRNCFAVWGEKKSFLVDCGLMAGANTPYPRLQLKKIPELQYVFLTHSHTDHTGAIPWLEQHGFTGTVVAAKETLEQLKTMPQNVLTLEQFEQSEELSFQWGCSGHCVGSVWYQFCFEGRKILFSGDYTEEGVVYTVDSLRNREADVAVLDCAYGTEERTGELMRKEFLSAAAVYCEKKRPVLFPVPFYGRGLEIVLILHRKWPELPVYGDAHFREQIKYAVQDGKWIKPEIHSELKTIRVLSLNKVPEYGICFVSGPQLKDAKHEQMARVFAERGGVILTGEIDRGGGSMRLYQEGLAEFCRIPVHSTNRESEALEKQNKFKQVIPYHSREWMCENSFLSL